MLLRPIVVVALAAVLALSGSIVLESSAVAARAGRRSTSVAEKPKRKKPTVKLAKTSLGKILVDTKGFTLYAFEPDGTDTVSSKCIDACADVWPALVAKKKPKAGKGLDQALLGIGGGGQVAYNDHLLYRFVNDTAAGQTNGQGVGNIWHVVGADGEPIT